MHFAAHRQTRGNRAAELIFSHVQLLQPSWEHDVCRGGRCQRTFDAIPRQTQRAKLGQIPPQRAVRERHSAQSIAARVEMAQASARLGDGDRALEAVVSDIEHGEVGKAEVAKLESLERRARQPIARQAKRAKWMIRRRRSEVQVTLQAITAEVEQLQVPEPVEDVGGKLTCQAIAVERQNRQPRAGGECAEHRAGVAGKSRLAERELAQARQPCKPRRRRCASQPHATEVERAQHAHALPATRQRPDDLRVIAEQHVLELRHGTPALRERSGELVEA